MSKSPDSFAPAMQNFVQAGQALAQNFLEFLNAQKAPPAPGMRAVNTPLAPDPEQLASLQKSYMEQQLLLWNSMLTRGKDEAVTPVVSPEPGDRRFSSPEWKSSPVFDYVRQSYLLNSRFVRELVEVMPADDDKAKTVHAFWRASILTPCRRPISPRPILNSFDRRSRQKARALPMASTI